MASELVPGCWWIELGSVNAFLIEDDVPTLVDAGTPWDEAEIRAAVAEAGIDVSEIERVLLTHYDLDHVGTLSAFAGEMDATVYAGSPDATILSGGQLPSLTTPKGVLQRLTGSFVDPPGLAVETVADGDRIGSVTVFETPGHTPGHVAYVSEPLGVGMVGDLVHEDDGALTPSPWYLCDDSEAVRESIERFAARSPPFEVLCMGHGEPILGDGQRTLETLAARL